MPVRVHNHASRLASLALPASIALAALTPHAAFTGDAEACSKGGAPAARHRLGAIVENVNAVSTDLVIVQSPVADLRTSTPFTPTEGIIERADGSVVPLRASQLGEMPDSSLSVVRSGLVPDVPLSPHTAYTLVIGNLAQRVGSKDDVSLAAESVRLPFTTGAGPRAVAKPLVLQEGSPKTVEIVPSATRVCCSRKACGLTYDNCVPRDRLTRELRDIRIVPTLSPDAIVSLRVATNRPADPTMDELGWITSAGVRSPVRYGYGSIESALLPLTANEHACVVAVATDLFTGVETLSEPLCVDGPSTLAGGTVDCKNVASLRSEDQCTTRTQELEGLAAACAANPFPPAPGSSSVAGNDGDGAGGGCSFGGDDVPGASSLGCLAIGAAACGLRRVRSRSRGR